MGLILYPEKKCLYCDAEYTPKTILQKFCCGDCRELYEKANRKKKVVDPTAKFKPVMEFIKQHYEETGEYLNYGKAVVLMEQQKKRRGRRRV